MRSLARGCVRKASQVGGGHGLQRGRCACAPRVAPAMERKRARPAVRKCTTYINWHFTLITLRTAVIDTVLDSARCASPGY